MRVQHNIMAMNAYRNYSSNTSALSKNLEKLSSGYKINRAGDDAAGLAISEKMRAQITGLETAQSNAKSGINLVQTAEGSLTEVHDMLNRMVKLADQSSNGTYDNETDRANLQKEVSQLQSEIDRIADSSNFNGINLLDGSVGGKADIAGDISLSDSKVTTSSTTTDDFAVLGDDSDGKTLSYTVAWKDGDGKEYAKTISLTMNKDSGGDTLVAADSTSYAAGSTDGKGTATGIRNAVLAELKKDSSLTGALDVSADGTAALKFTSKVQGADGAQITSISGSNGSAFIGGVVDAGIGTTAGDVVVGKDSMQILDLSKLTAVDGSSADVSADTIADNTFEVDGKKFVLAATGSTVDHLKNVPSDVHVIDLAGGSYSATGDAANVASEISRVTGKDFQTVATADAAAGLAAYDIVYAGDDTLKSSGQGLTLQIGDTSDSFNQLTVSIQDMHTNSLGISDIDISSQSGAQAATDAIKNAINTVSSVRGTLGATQNRLEHTINNLSVMTENTQDAESTIRDTDVADEMMSYTKNNILVQSAQAMLAQANQVPQGVLQLLQ